MNLLPRDADRQITGVCDANYLREEECANCHHFFRSGDVIYDPDHDLYFCNDQCMGEWKVNRFGDTTDTDE